MCNLLISKPLPYFCNKSSQTGVFLGRLKYAIVKHLYTNGDRFSTSNGDRSSASNGDRSSTSNGDRSSTSNYIAISLLPGFSMVLENTKYCILNQHQNMINTLTTE
jgi:hypothetical protein